MEEILQVLSNLKMKCYVMGDFNVNLLHINENATTYINMFQCYSFSQIIIKPTRVTDRSATLIGHIWTNDLQNYIKNGILYKTISDHFPVLSWFTLNVQSSASYVDISRRMYNSDNIRAFREDLRNFNWNSDFLNIEEVQKIFS